MFSLILALIAIVITAGIAIATVYYGGAQLNSGGAKSNAARYLNEGAQISGAVNVYTNDHAGAFPDRPEDLVPTYLKSIPEGDWSFESEYIIRTGLTEAECIAANAVVGINDVLNCDDPEMLPQTPCCRTTP